MGMGVYNFICMRIFHISEDIMQKYPLSNSNFKVIPEKSNFVVSFGSLVCLIQKMIMTEVFHLKSSLF